MAAHVPSLFASREQSVIAPDRRQSRSALFAGDTMASYPPAYHITWGTYGTRLRGGPAPYVDRDHNVYGTPLPTPDPELEAMDRRNLKHDPVYLTREQIAATEAAIREVAARYEWPIHALSAKEDHVHVVITAPREGEALRDALKAVACKALNKQFGRREWWAEKGSAKYLYERPYFLNAVAYVQRQHENI